LFRRIGGPDPPGFQFFQVQDQEIPDFLPGYEKAVAMAEVVSGEFNVEWGDFLGG
jgi:hypothetical protein